MNESIANTSFTPARLAGVVIGSLALIAGNAHAMNGAQLGGYGIKSRAARVTLVREATPEEWEEVPA